MIEICNIETYGWQAAMRGMRNPMNSWSYCDSTFNDSTSDEVQLGEHDLALATKLVKAGTDHRKFMRMIGVSLDITAPLYWWKEFDTYKIGTVANSCSTMHKIHAKELTISDFEVDPIIHISEDNGEISQIDTSLWLRQDISRLNFLREQYNKTKDKRYWRLLIQLLPSSYKQKRTVALNYEVLCNIYHSRKDHKLKEWHGFCEIVEMLPYAKELIISEIS